MDLQEKVKRVQEFRLIDDVFFEVFAEDILELYIIYISEFDFLKGGLTTYHIDKVIRGNGEVVDDGLHEIFVNTAVDDGSSIAGLMSCFTRKEVTNREFPAVTRRFISGGRSPSDGNSIEKINNPQRQCAFGDFNLYRIEPDSPSSFW